MKPLLGILLKVLSALAFTIMAASLKLVSTGYPTGELVFFRSFFALLPLLTWLTWQGDLVDAVRTNDMRGHLKRGAFGSAGMFCGFVALAYLPLHDAVAIGYATPLIVVVLAAIVLKETVRAYRWSAVALGFVGVLIMLSPHLGGARTIEGGSAFGATFALIGACCSAGATIQVRRLTATEKTGAIALGFVGVLIMLSPHLGGARTIEGASAFGAMFALIGACCSAGATIQVRRLTATEKTGAIVLYFSLLTTVLGLTTIVLGWRLPPLEDFVLLVLIGVLGGIGQILLTSCYRHADASIIAPFEYTTMIWALLFGWFVFGELPTRAVVGGGSIVAAAGIFVLWREHQLGLERRKGIETVAQRPVGG